jgi:hypothetical protein
MKKQLTLHVTLPIFLLALLMAGACSRDQGPMAPDPLIVDVDDPGDFGPIGARSSEWDSIFDASDHSDYSLIAGTINGGSGGSLEGTVYAYDDTFHLVVPAGAYTGTSKLKLLVPNSGVPVFRLEPHGLTFDEDLTVTLDYSRWLGVGGFDHGDNCELLYMNEATEEFDALSPPVSFLADSLQPTVSFETDHFSRWIAKKK